ncbi:hypothetical protein KVV02_003927 [Mortierella alpina]|uniref:Uncharacterized protein n=1 Tax=Mortierella alpina TaxID=64518 RepID=A0A9P7ZYT3_MORAP|nr:hypothetical protein KVV02_003927 [Mortierella alpina]
MPSVVNTNLSSSLHPPSELDFVSDDALSYTRASSFHPQDSAQKDHTVQKLKELGRRQWSDPDDEFSVPIHTESPLITKKPLGTSSFLLHYRAMHRSVEIMTPPVSQIGRMHDLASPSPLHPTIPDGPIYIHHRSTMSASPLSKAISCSHISCFEHNQCAPLPSRSSTCQQRRLPLGSLDGQESQDTAVSSHVNSRAPSPWLPEGSLSSSSSSTTLGNSTASTRSADEHSFLESHIASIGQWLLFNNGGTA